MSLAKLSDFSLLVRYKVTYSSSIEACRLKGNQIEKQLAEQQHNKSAVLFKFKESTR